MKYWCLAMKYLKIKLILILCSTDLMRDTKTSLSIFSSLSERSRHEYRNLFDNIKSNIISETTIVTQTLVQPPPILILNRFLNKTARETMAVVEKTADPIIPKANLFAGLSSHDTYLSILIDINIFPYHITSQMLTIITSTRQNDFQDNIHSGHTTIPMMLAKAITRISSFIFFVNFIFSVPGRLN